MWPLQVKNFTGRHIAILRKKKATYSILEFSRTRNAWRPAVLDPVVNPITVIRKPINNNAGRNDASDIHANIAIDSTTRLIECKASGLYLKYGVINVPVIEKRPKSARSFPASYFKNEFTCQFQEEAVDIGPLWEIRPPPVVAPRPLEEQLVGVNMLNAILVRNRPRNPPPVIRQTNSFVIEKIPQRIAWIVGQDAEAKGDTCPISLESLSPITASVTSCYHVFKTEAIQTWFETSNKCPMCNEITVFTECFIST